MNWPNSSATGDQEELGFLSPEDLRFAIDDPPLKAPDSEPDEIPAVVGPSTPAAALKMFLRGDLGWLTAARRWETSPRTSHCRLTMAAPTSPCPIRLVSGLSCSCLAASREAPIDPSLGSSTSCSLGSKTEPTSIPFTFAKHIPRTAGAWHPTNELTSMLPQPKTDVGTNSRGSPLLRLAQDGAAAAGRWHRRRGWP